MIRSRGSMFQLRSVVRCLMVVMVMFASAVVAEDTPVGGQKGGDKAGTEKKSTEKKSGDKKTVEKKGVDKSDGGQGALKAAAKEALLKAHAEGQVVKVDPETAALAFAGEHHSELKTLVESLKSANPAGYKKAIVDLARTQERLSKLQGNKAGNRYDHELALWKLDSRIRLTAARSAMKDTDELRAELKALVEQKQALVLQRLKVDHELAAARLAKIDEQSRAAEANPALAVDAEVDRLLNSAKSKKAGVTANFKADKTKKPSPGAGQPKGEAKPTELKPEAKTP